MTQSITNHGSAGSREEWSLVCDRCGGAFDMEPLVFGCPACASGGVQSVLDLRFRPHHTPAPLSARKGAGGLCRYLDLLPSRDADDWVSLGEGGTNLQRSRLNGPRLGLKALYFKNETTNPTWSFKDRYVAVTVNVARRFGFRRVVVSSTGNLGVSVAAYAAAAGMDCLFIALPQTARPIVDQARLHGARVVITSAESRQEVFEHCARHEDWFPVGLFLNRPVQNPFGIEGYKTFAYEMIDDLGRAPAAVLFPCARGNGLYGAWKGFREALEWGWVSTAPAMVGCQPEGANSLEVSLRQGAERAVELPRIESVAVSAAETIADDHALAAIRESGGDALSVTDQEILAATRELGREGLCVEASSALPVACLPRLVESGRYDPADPLVCVLTAAGIKWPEHLDLGGPPIDEVENDAGVLDAYLAGFGRDGNARSA